MPSFSPFDPGLWQADLRRADPAPAAHVQAQIDALRDALGHCVTALRAQAEARTPAAAAAAPRRADDARGWITILGAAVAALGVVVLYLLVALSQLQGLLFQLVAAAPRWGS